MDDVANLSIRVDSRSARTADKNLDGLTRASSRAEKATDSLKRGYMAATATFLAGAAAFGGTANKLIQVERQTGILVSSLRTVTGSAAGARDAFNALEGLASRLPVSIPEITEAFIKMKALGLNPTEEALISFTNTASAMGKNLNQFVEAVADAATGEFERLKEFGIRASQSGDNVAFTFQGVTTNIKKNANDITAYLQRIGEVEFAGAAADRMAELDGQISNLSDSWDSLFRTINEKGAAELISNSVGLATDAIQELTAFIGSGQLETALDNIGLMFAESFDISKVSDELITEFGSTFDALGYAGGETVDFILEAFSKWPRNVSTITKIIGTEIANLVKLAELYGEKLAFNLDPKNWFNDEPAEKLEAAQNRLARKSEELSRALANGAVDHAPAIIKLRQQIYDLTQEQAAYIKQIETGSSKQAEFAAREESLASIRAQGVDEALTGLEAGLELDEKRASMLDVLRQKYDEQKASVKSLNDVLAELPGGGGPAGGSPGGSGSPAGGTDSGEGIGWGQHTRGARGGEAPPLPDIAEVEDYWAKYLAAAEENLGNFDMLAGETINNFSRGFGNAFESIIFDSENLGDAINNLAEGMLRSIVNALGQMAAQWLAYQAVQLLVGKTTQATAAVGMTSNALAMQQMAALSAFASTAAIPIVGPFAAPGAAVAALAATTPFVAAIGAFSAAGMAHEGMDSIPQTGTWLLEKGERVTTERTSAKLDKTLSDIQKNQGGAGNISVINQTTGRVDNATTQRLNNGDLAIILQEVAGAIGNPNSDISRSLSSNTTASRSR